jgi:hypothetical protein
MTDPRSTLVQQRQAATRAGGGAETRKVAGDKYCTREEFVRCGTAVLPGAVACGACLGWKQACTGGGRGCVWQRGCC